MSITNKYIISVTGVTGKLREHLKLIVGEMPACEYSGSLISGKTTHLVYKCSLEKLFSSPKYILAKYSGVPIVSSDWLEDSYYQGFLLSPSNYILIESELQNDIKKTCESKLNVPESIERLRRQNIPATGNFLAYQNSPGLARNGDSSNHTGEQVIRHEVVLEAAVRSPRQGRRYGDQMAIEYAHLENDVNNHMNAAENGNPTKLEQKNFEVEAEVKTNIKFRNLYQECHNEMPLVPDSGFVTVRRRNTKLNRLRSTDLQTRELRLTNCADSQVVDVPGRLSLMASYIPTSIVILGPQTNQLVGLASSRSIMEFHQLPKLHGIRFYSSAQIKLTDGRILVFQPGDASHGAKMVYDVRFGGTKIYAHALVCSIYTLPGNTEVWFQHKYFLSPQDLDERPTWKKSLQDSVIRQDELLLTIGTYHSPLNLIEEEFGVAYTRMAKADSQIPLIRGLYLPLMECRQKCMPILKQSRD